MLASVPWGAKYVLDDDIVRYVSLENFKYDQDLSTNNTSPAQQRHVISVLVHTSVPFGLAHKDVLRRCTVGSEVAEGTTADAMQHPDTQSVIDAILQSVVQPQMLPALVHCTPSKVQLVGWENSQVTTSYHAGAADQVGLDTSRGVVGSTAQQGLPITDAPPALVLTVDTNGSTMLMGNESQQHGSPLLVLAGDAFTESNFDGCLTSARFAAQAVAKHLKH